MGWCWVYRQPMSSAHAAFNDSCFGIECRDIPDSTNLPRNYSVYLGNNLPVKPLLFLDERDGRHVPYT